MQTTLYRKSTVNKSLESFVKKLNGSAVFSEPKERLTDKKIEKICRRIKLSSNQTIKKLLK
jgi:DNA-directed RNA polymerase subunit N (RpoN/RPB10)